MIRFSENDLAFVGMGCLIDGSHVLTFRHVITAATANSNDPQKIWVGLRTEEATIPAHIVSSNGLGPISDELVLLEFDDLELTLDYIEPVEFATPLRHFPKKVTVLGFGQYGSQEEVGNTIGALEKGLIELNFKGRLEGLSGAPVWSNDLGALVGLAFAGDPSQSVLAYVPSQELCAAYPELPVRFQIGRSDRPEITNFDKDDPNLHFFGAGSNNGKRRLSATLTKRPDGFADVRLKYEILPGSPPGRGRFVTFITYPDMEEYEIFAELDSSGKAEVECRPMMPDFTVAAIGDGGETRVTLNLEPLYEYLNKRQKDAKAQGIKAPQVVTSKELALLEKAPENSSKANESKENLTPSPETPSGAYRPTYAVFGNDLVAFDAKAFKQPLTDALGNGVYAQHLAQLIIAKRTPLPLSLGLFGDWGAGKSYFMRLLHQEIKTLSENKELKDNNGHDVFCRKVVQIHFNAWHYLDTNLWANLVCEIFDNLFQSLSDREGASKTKVEELKKKLAEESALAAEAKKALGDAKKAREEAETKLKTAAKEREEQEHSVALFLDDLKQVAADSELQKKLQELAKGFGLTRLSESYTELEKSAEDARSLAGRFRSLGLTLLSPEGRWQRLGLLIAALVIPVILALAVPWLLGMKEELAGFTRSVTAAVSLLGTVAAWISAQTKRGTELLNKLETTFASVKQARENVRKQKQPAAEQAKLDERIKQEAEAQHALQEAEAKVRAIESELRELAPGRRLLKFLEQRTGANDYRQHLGMVSLVRRDFKQLSDLLQEGNEFKEDGQPMLDRIVLYIDDLDRCKSSRVIEVLEAVHLLLAFPIFAVVVAVDPRWLRKSLLEHYPTLLLGGKDKDGKLIAESRESLASPQDFLEKIFQVPFQLEPIEKDGFTKLVTDLLPIAEKKPAQPDAAKKPDGQAPPPVQPPNPPPGGLVTPAASNIGTPPASTPGTPPPPSDAPLNPPPPPAPKPEVPAKPALIIPERLQLESWEQLAVQDCHPLFRTPRAVKRLANTYCLIRSGVDSERWNNFIGAATNPVAEYRTPLLMLAVAAAYPGLARQWFDGLLENKSWMPVGSQAPTADGNAEWQNLGGALTLLAADKFAPFKEAQVEYWVPKVKRFSF